MSSEGLDFGLALAKRRDAHREAADAVVKIAAE
jgi:hypothetical protein